MDDLEISRYTISVRLYQCDHDRIKRKGSLSSSLGFSSHTDISKLIRDKVREHFLEADRSMILNRTVPLTKRFQYYKAVHDLDDLACRAGGLMLF